MTPQGPLSFIAMIVTDSIEVGRRAVDRGLQGAGTARPPGPPLTLEEKNLYRAMGGGGVLAACVYVLVAGWPVGLPVPPIPPMYMAGVVGLSLIYLGVGLYGAKIFPVDAMAVIWSAALTVAGLACFALNVQPFGPDMRPLVPWTLRALYLIGAVACGLRLVVLVRSARTLGLPDASKVKGLLSGGMASQRTVHALLNGRPVRSWWRFW